MGEMTRDEWMRRTGPLYPAIVAVCCLTAVPLPHGLNPSDDDLARSVEWFPVVGALLGLVLWAFAWLLTAIGLVPALAMVAVVLAAAALTRTRLERGLAGGMAALVPGVNADSGPATGGLIAVAGLLALRGVGLIGIDSDRWLAALAISQASSLWTVLLVRKLGERTSSAGPGQVWSRALLARDLSWRSLGVISGAFAIGAVVLGLHVGFLAVLLAAAVSLGVGAGLKRRFGGVTESLLAMAACTGEVVVLYVFAAAYPPMSSPWMVAGAG